MLTKDIIPILILVLVVIDGQPKYHSVSAFGSSTGTLTGISIVLFAEG